MFLVNQLLYAIFQFWKMSLLPVETLQLSPRALGIEKAA